MYSEPVRFLIASPCWTPRAALLPPCPLKKSPRRSGTWLPTTANSSGYAFLALGNGSGPGADQVTDSGVYRAIFLSRGHERLASKPHDVLFHCRQNHDPPDPISKKGQTPKG